MSFIICLDVKEKEEPALQMRLDKILHNDNYFSELFYNSDNIKCFFTSYPDYPFQKIENEKYLIFLEGKIYGKKPEELDKELQVLGDLIFSAASGKKTNEIAAWLLERDGDFFVFFYNKEEKSLAFINDAYGLMPFYYFNEGNRIFISREIQFILSGTNEIGFDKISAAQYLLFGNVLGSGTVFKGVLRSALSTLIFVSLKEGKTTVQNMPVLNCDRKLHSGRNIAENAKELVDILNESIKQINTLFHSYNFVHSLSGGLDSRAVAASLCKNNIAFTGATILSKLEKDIIDIEVAEVIAKKLNIPWNLYKLEHPHGSDVSRLLHQTSGLNSLGMSFICRFYDDMKKRHGEKIVYITGETGLDLRNYYPHRKIRDKQELVEYILEYRTISDIKVVSRITGLPEDDIRNSVNEHLESYPEKDLGAQFVHFHFLNYNFYLCFEAIERSRKYFWTATPLDFTRFFNYAVNVPDEQKSNYKLFRHFLNLLSPEIASVTNPKSKMPITSNRFIVGAEVMSNLQWLFNKLPFHIRKIIKKCRMYERSRAWKNDSNFKKCLEEQLSNSAGISELFVKEEIIKYLNNISKQQFYELFTITSLIDEYSSKNPILNNYADSDFN